MSVLPSISAVLVRPLERALSSQPGALAQFYAATDLTAAIVADPEGRVSPAQFCVAWATAIQLTSNPTLALDIADATPPGAFGVVEYVCRSTATLRDALKQWCRYLGILDDAVEVGLVEEAPGALLRVQRESEAPAPASHELCFALVVRNARLMVGGAFRVTEVRFTHHVGPAHAERLRSWFDAPITFGARFTELVLEDAVLGAPLSGADPHLLAILLQTAEEQRRVVHPSVTERTRGVLRRALSTDDAQLEAVAKRLGKTARSLQRDLKDEHQTFQELRDQVRQELADRYLRQGLTLAEVSFLLGFSEPSAFFRAFKRWTGLTPFERRASLIPG